MESSKMQTNFAMKKPAKNKIFDPILPVMGSISYEIFSVNIMNPRRFTEIFSTRSTIAADILWFNAHIGFGVYIFHQNFLQSASLPWKITYSVFGSALFNFGTVLMWGTSKALLPNVPEGLKLLFGLGSGLSLLYIGWNLTDFLNKEVHQSKEHCNINGCELEHVKNNVLISHK